MAGRDRQQVQQHVEVLLADGKTRLNVAITAQSAEKLGLDEGQEVLVLLKAPWVGITLDPAAARQADNQHGTHTYRMRVRTVRSTDDPHTHTPLCATQPQAQAAGLAEGTEAIAYFNADRIILATLC